MSDIKELSINETALISGGNANSNFESRVGNIGSTGYGGQANGLQPNYAAGYAGANMYNDLTSSCGLGIVGGIAGLGAAFGSKSIASGVSAIAGIIAGCKPDSNSNSKGVPFR